MNSTFRPGRCVAQRDVQKDRVFLLTRPNESLPEKIRSPVSSVQAPGVTGEHKRIHSLIYAVRLEGGCGRVQHKRYMRKNDLILIFKRV